MRSEINRSIAFYFKDNRPYQLTLAVCRSRDTFFYFIETGYSLLT